MLTYGLQKVSQALYPQENGDGRRDLSAHSVWPGISLLFRLQHRGIVLVTPVFWEEREKRGFGKCHHTELPEWHDKSPSWANHGIALAQSKSLAIEERDRSILEKRYFARITRIFTFPEVEIPYFPPQICSQMLLLKQMFSQHSPSAQSSPPCYAHISNTKCILVFPFAGLGKLISTYTLKASSSFSWLS